MGWRDQASLRQNNLDLLRFALACAVIFSHSFPLVNGSDKAEPLYRITGGQITCGSLAVNWFFVISGYLVAASWFNSSGLLDFLRKRLLRIYPGFIVATAIAALVVVPLASADPASSLVAFKPVQWALNALRLKDYVQIPSFMQNPFPRAVNGALWSIPYEFGCYIGIALLGLTGLLRNRRFIAVVFTLCIVISIIFILLRLTPGGRFPGRMFYPPRLLPYYLAGTAFYLFREQIPHSRRIACLCALLLIPAAFPQWGVALVLPIAGTYLLFWVAYHPALRLHNWARYGDFSYGIYLYGFPIQQLLVHGLGPMHPLLLFTIATPLSILAGAASWHLIEKHCLRLKPRRAIAKTPFLVPA